MINEIQYAPVSPESEWIEIYNTEDREVELINFTVSDKVTTSEPLNIIMPPNSFAIITKDSAGVSKIYKLDSTKVYMTNLPTLNNTDDDVVIKSEDVVLDSVSYSSKWGLKSKSLERINYFAPSNDESNWGSSESEATPLLINSNAKYVDLRIVEATLAKGGLSVIIENIGNVMSTKTLLTMFVNLTIKSQTTIIEIEPQSDTEGIINFEDIDYTPVTGDEIRLLVEQSVDIDLSNNKFTLYIPTLTKRNDILINEIMFDVDKNSYEFIELYNNSNEELQISNWFMADATDIKNERFNQIVTNASIEPNGYVIIVSDSAVFKHINPLEKEKVLFTKRKFSLNKSDDIICLYNSAKTVIDSLAYSELWHEDFLPTTQNISLEKIRPDLPTQSEENWKTCTDDAGNTALRSNSYNKANESKDKISATPNPFSPTSSGEPYIVIDFELSFINALVDCDIYYPNGTKAFNLTSAKFVSKNGFVTWNGRDETGYLLPVGPYVAVIAATNQDSGESEVLKTVIVIAK